MFSTLVGLTVIVVAIIVPVGIVGAIMWRKEAE